MDNLVYGCPIKICPEIIKGYEQARKHKNKRINKKWKKRYGYKPVYDTNIIFVDGTAYMSQKTFLLLKRRMNNV